uniref:Uncharacterized protein n=1 Tax=Trypanosoma congolense (strain IL3000) TaxID=1068625 RepID=G0UYH3_TRYCI|nr:conserved hypothetical protein [Trypanosoma congolense IL3000]
MSKGSAEARSRSSGRNQRSAPSTARAGRSSPSRMVPAEDPPLVPVMPAFFPDPAALDLEDVHYKLYCDEILTREYESAVEALYAALHSCSDPYTVEVGASRMGRGNIPAHLAGGDRSAANMTCSMMKTEAVMSPDVPLEDYCLSNAEMIQAQITGAAASLPKEPDERRIGGFTSVTNFFKNSTTTDEKAGTDAFYGRSYPSGMSNLTWCNVGQWERLVFPMYSGAYGSEETGYAQEKPDSFTDSKTFIGAPHPVEILEGAEKIGFTNAIRAIQLKALELANQRNNLELKLFAPSQGITEKVPPIASPQTTGRRSSSVNSNNEKINVHQAPNTGVVPPLVPNDECPVISMNDVILLEACERASAEMHCESLCNDIISLAADLHVSRFFDSMANTYTALSTWDGLHDSIVRSFIPERPHVPIKLGDEVLKALAIHSDSKRRKRRHRLESQGHQFGNDIVAGASGIAGADECPNYLNMLPSWAPVPSLMSADDILSFHENVKELAKSLNALHNIDVDIKATIQNNGAANTTFSQLLASSVDDGLRSTSVQGVANAAQWSMEQHNIDISSCVPSVFNVQCGDGESPGSPPRPIPIDDYARYVIPSNRGNLPIDHQERDDIEGSGEKGLQQKRVRSSLLPGDSHVDTVSKGGIRRPGDLQKSLQSLATKGVADGAQPHRGVSLRSLRTSSVSRKRGKRSVATHLTEDLSTSDGCEAENASAYEDDWKKALRQLPHGTLGRHADVCGTQANGGAETLVYIEGGVANTFAVGFKSLTKVKKGKDATGARGVGHSAKHRCGDGGQTTENVFFSGPNEKLQVGVSEEGRTLFLVAHEETVAGSEQDVVQNGSQFSNTDEDNQRKRGLIFLTQKQRKDLEERRRRRKAAAERAAYESLFFSLPKATNTETCVEEPERQGPPPDEGETKISTIVAEPGVVVEKFTSLADNSKGRVAAGTKAMKSGEFGGFNMQRSSNIIADGGEWVVPEGKLHWSCSGGENQEKNMERQKGIPRLPHTDGANPFHRSAVPSQAVQPSSETPVLAASEGDKTGRTTPQRCYKGPARAAVTRYLRREPPTVLFSHQKGEINDQDGQPRSKQELGEANKKETRSRQSAPAGSSRCSVLPRLPCLPLDKECTPRRFQKLKTTPKSKGCQEIRPASCGTRSH